MTTTTNQNKSTLAKMDVSSYKARSLAKREPEDEATDAESSSAAAKRKRTRPVSACEACRAHKVRCILKADQPVCERCSASGKECLFRIDDLRPDFRAERFAHLGPPGKDARSIKSKPKDRTRRTSDTAALTRSGGSGKSADRGSARRGSLSVSAAGSSGSEDEAISKTIKRSKEGSRHIGSVDHKQFRESNRKVTPAKFARPAFPQSSVSSTGASSARGAIAAPASVLSPPSYIDKASGESSLAQPAYGPQSLGHRPSYITANSGYGPTGHVTNRPSSGQLMSEQQYGHPVQPPPPPIPLLSGGQRPGGERYFMSQQQGSGLANPPVQHQTYSMSHQPTAQAPDSGPHMYHSPRSISSMGSGRSPPSHQAAAVVGETGSGMIYSPSYQAYRSIGISGSPSASAPSHSSSSRTSAPSHPSSSRTSAPSHPSSSRTSLPPIRTAIPSLRHDDLSAGSPPYYRDRAGVREEPQASENRRLSSQRRASVSGGKVSGQQSGKESHPIQVLGPGNGVAGFGVGSPSSQSSSTKKHSLVVPFFRWFGSTANTPGYRRIKVAVNPDLPADEEEDSVMPDGEEDEKGSFARDVYKEESPPSTVSNVRPQQALVGQNPSPNACTTSSTKDPPSFSPPRLEGSPRSEYRRRSGNGGHLGLSALDTESTSSASRDLFDPLRPRYPRQDVLLHLSELFIQLFRTNLCPWVQSEFVLEGARNATLPAILANSICAMTARFSDWAELRRKSPRSAGDPFSEMAKTLIVPMLSWPSLDVIEALILLSYAEFGAGSDSGLWMYSGMGMRMATDLGLQHESTVRSLPKVEQEKARWLFWSGCYAIDRITCFGTGRPVTLLEHTIDCRPPRVEPGSQCFYASQIIQLLQRRGRMGELLNRKDDFGQINLNEKKAKLMEMWQECAAYFQSLPSTCAFSVQSFKRAASNNEGPAFLFLHVLFQSTISLLERPGIMRGRNVPECHPVSTSSMNFSAPNVAHISASASRSIADMIALAAQVDPKSLQTSPYLDQLILPTGRAFHGEREAIKEAMKQYGYAADQSRAGSPSRTGAPDDRLITLLSMRKAVSDSLHNCINWLGTLAHYWGGASWPARALEQEAAGASDIVPDERDDDAMQAPLRDMELLSAWARDKLKQAKSKMASRRGSVDHTRAGSSGSASGTSGATAAAAAATRMGGELTNMGSPGAATSIENLLAAANVAREGQEGAQEGEDRDAMDSDRALGLALSGQLATSAEINVSALVDLWTEEQRRNSIFSSNEDVSSTTGRNDGEGSSGDATSGRGMRGGAMMPWADTPLSGSHQRSSLHDASRTSGQLPPSQGHTPTNNPSAQAFLASWIAPSPHSSHHLHGEGVVGTPRYHNDSGSDGRSHHENQQQQPSSSSYGTVIFGAAAPTSTSSFNNAQLPTMGFSALQLEELLSADLLSSGNDVIPLELPDEALFRFGETEAANHFERGAQGATGAGVGAGAAGMGDEGLGTTGGGAGGTEEGQTIGAAAGAAANGTGGTPWGLSQQHLSSALFGFR